MNDIAYGPLKQLIGVWEGSEGIDIAPEPDGAENNPYYETITLLEIYGRVFEHTDENELIRQ